SQTPSRRDASAAVHDALPISQAAQRLLSEPDHPQILMLTAFGTDDFVHRAPQSGAAGYSRTDTPPEDVAGGAGLQTARAHSRRRSDEHTTQLQSRCDLACRHL